MGSTHHGTNAYTGTYGGVFRLRLDSRTRHRIRDGFTRREAIDMTEIQCATKSEFYEAIQRLYEMTLPFTAYTDSLTITLDHKLEED